VSPAEVRTELERILRHTEFQASERLRDFLRFVVGESLAGRADAIKGSRIARRVFDRGEDFDGTRDPVVRIEAGRLRRRLEHYYFVAGERDPVRIEIPKGGYVPLFTRQNGESTSAGSSGPVARESRRDPSPTICIVPFRDLAGDPESAFFGAGLVAELSSEVNRYESVVAVPCQPEEDPTMNGQRGGEARFILEGSVRRDESELKLVVHLTDTVAVRQLWSESYKVPFDADHLIAVQEDLARGMMAAIADEYGVISRRLVRESRDKRPTELSTYEALLRFHYYLLSLTPETGDDAFRALHAATEREPSYGPAWSAFASLHAHAFLFDRPGLEDPLGTALRYAKRGAALAPESQLARSHLAHLYLLTGEMALFHEEADAALALNPSSPNYAGSIGYLFALAGEYDRAETLLGQAFDSGLRQPTWFHHGLFLVYYAKGEYEEAYLEAQRGFPPTFWEPALRAAALGKLGRVEEAEESLAEARRLRPDFDEKVEELLVRSAQGPEMVQAIIDGLRRAGLGAHAAPGGAA
jgi:adenylate cyclase